MKQFFFGCVLLTSLSTHIAAQGILGSDEGVCYPPEPPYPFKLTKDDPLYATARDEHQRFLEQIESYVNCLDREHGRALGEFTASFNLFLQNFGNDAVFKYDVDPISGD